MYRLDSNLEPGKRMTLFRRLRSYPRRLLSVLYALFLFLAVEGLHAQDNTGIILGTVREETGGLLVGAKVTLKNREAFVATSTITSLEGRYTFTSVKTGVHTVEAELQGYRKVTQQEIKVSAHQRVVLDFALARENSTISGSPPPEGKSNGTAKGELDSITFYDSPQFKQGALDNSAEFGGHTSAGRAEASNRLVQGVAQLKTETPLAGSGSTVKPTTNKKQSSIGTELKLKQALRLNPGSFEANHNLGEFYIQQGKLVAAIPYLEMAQKVNSTHYVNSYDLALAYLQTQDLAKARQQIQGMLRQKEGAELHNLLGDVEEGAGNFVVAAGEYQRAAHMEPSEKHIFDWGNQLLVHQAYEPATQVFGHGVERYPRSAKLRIGLGIALYSRSHYDDAVKSLCAAVDLDPTDARPYFFLGKVFDVSTAMAAEVTRRLAHFVQLDPKNALARYYYALSLWKGQRGQNPRVDLDQIEALLKDSVRLDPKMTEAHFQLGILYADQRRYAEAIREYQTAIKLQPDLADAYYRLGQAYQRAGQKARAQEQMEIYKRLHDERLARGERNRRETGQLILTVNESPK